MEAAKAPAAGLVDDYGDNVLIRAFGVFVSIGSVAFLTATIAAGVALRRQAGAPFGPVGLALFIAAVLLFVRSQSPGRAPAALGQPGPA